MPVYYNGEKVTNALPITKLQSKIVTENETTVTPDIGYNGLSSVTVNVPTGEYNINSEILEDGTQRMVIELPGELPKYIQLPEFFSTCYQIFNMYIGDGKMLLSAPPYWDSYTNIGLWLYDDTNESFSQVYETGWSWSNFQIIDNHCLISSSELNDYRCKGILDYNINTGEVVKIYSEYSNWQTYQKIKDVYVVTGGTNAFGALLYTPVDNTVVSLFTDKSGWQSIIPLDNGCLISNTSSNIYGLYYFNYDLKTVNKISDEGTLWKNYYKHDSKCIFNSSYTSSSAAEWGMLLFDEELKILTKLSTVGTGFDTFIPMGDRCLITAGSKSSSWLDIKGVLLYDTNTSTLTRLFDKYDYWDRYDVIGEKCILSSSNGGIGVYLYDNSDTSFYNIIEVNNFGWLIEFIHLSPTDVLLTGKNKGAVWVYLETNSAERLTDVGTSITITSYYKIDNNISFISNDSGTAIWKLNIQERSVAKALPQVTGAGNLYGEGLDTFYTAPNGCYIESSNKKKNNRKIYYNSLTDEFTIVGIYF